MALGSKVHVVLILLSPVDWTRAFVLASCFNAKAMGNRFDDAYDLTLGCRRPPWQGGLQGVFDRCSYIMELANLAITLDNRSPPY